MHVALLGDSTIDNVVWTGPGKEVPAQLRTVLEQGCSGVNECRVSNLAADGFTSSKLLHGAVPTVSLVKRQEAGDPFPERDPEGIFRPLDALAALDPPATHAVVSIGGNDIRKILGSLHCLEQVVQDFQRNYSSILDCLCKMVPNVVLMFQYRPCLNMDLTGGYGVYKAIGSLPGPGDAVAKLNNLMHKVYNPILRIAFDRQLPVVDLPRTFNIKDDSLYRCQIEPSVEGGRLIAELIGYVVRNHDFTGPSTLYLKQSGVIASESNSGDACWSIAPSPVASQQNCEQPDAQRQPKPSKGTFSDDPKIYMAPDGISPALPPLTTYESGRVHKRYSVNEQGHINGLYEELYDDDVGTLKHQASYVDGVMHGQEKVFYPDGTLFQSRASENGWFHGVEERFHKSGAIRSRFCWDKGMMVGYIQHFYESGVLQSMEYRDEAGIRHMCEYSFDEASRVKRMACWNKGSLVMEQLYSEDGVIVSDRHFGRQKSQDRACVVS
mmetsp:Transcript_163600/g.298476  ORF Transcript_163600/g.298476 Transcript_163600/m.298476 type:complete len:495 (+) Transcript_163600:77-1561(+)